MMRYKKVVVMVVAVVISGTVCAMNDGGSWWSRLTGYENPEARNTRAALARALMESEEKEGEGETKEGEGQLGVHKDVSIPAHLLAGGYLSQKMMREEMSKHLARRQLKRALADKKIVPIIQAIHGCQQVLAEAHYPQELDGQVNKVVASLRRGRDGWASMSELSDRLQEAILSHNIPGTLGVLDAMRQSTGTRVEQVMYGDLSFDVYVGGSVRQPSLLHCAVRKLDVDLAQQLINARASVNETFTQYGVNRAATPLCDALGQLCCTASKNVAESSKAMIRMLVGAGASVNASGCAFTHRSNFGSLCPLEWALRACMFKPHAIDMVQLLVNHRADVGRPGEQAAGIASVCSEKFDPVVRKNILEMLFQAGSSVHYGLYSPGDRNAKQPLMLVCRESDNKDIFAEAEACATAQWLIEHGANINEKSEQGYTPLSYAISAGSVDIVRLLFRQGAEIDGRAWSVLSGPNRQKIVALLLSAGATDAQMWQLANYAQDASYYTSQISKKRLPSDKAMKLDDAIRVRNQFLSGGLGVDDRQEGEASADSDEYRGLLADMLCRQENLSKARVQA